MSAPRPRKTFRAVLISALEQAQQDLALQWKNRHHDEIDAHSLADAAWRCVRVATRAAKSFSHHAETYGDAELEEKALAMLPEHRRPHFNRLLASMGGRVRT